MQSNCKPFCAQQCPPLVFAPWFPFWGCRSGANALHRITGDDHPKCVWDLGHTSAAKPPKTPKSTKGRVEVRGAVMRRSCD
jgi:hypothetical protein